MIIITTVYIYSIQIEEDKMETITIKEKKYSQEDYVKQWTESIGVGSLWMLKRSSHWDDDQKKRDQILKLVEEMAINNFKELLKEEDPRVS